MALAPGSAPPHLKGINVNNSNVKGTTTVVWVVHRNTGFSRCCCCRCCCCWWCCGCGDVEEGIAVEDIDSFLNPSCPRTGAIFNPCGSLFFLPFELFKLFSVVVFFSLRLKWLKASSRVFVFVCLYHSVFFIVQTSIMFVGLLVNLSICWLCFFHSLLKKRNRRKSYSKWLTEALYASDQRKCRMNPLVDACSTIRFHSFTKWMIVTSHAFTKDKIIRCNRVVSKTNIIWW